MKTRKFRKSMLSAIAVLLVAVISLTGATYAWFTAGAEADVAGLTATVESGTGLLISTDGSAWVSNAEFTLGEGFILKALSTDGVVGKSVAGQLDFYRATLDTTVSPNLVKGATLQTWTANTAAEDNTKVIAGKKDGFIAYDIYFNNVDQPAKDVVVSGGITSTASNKSAIRIAYIVQGNLSGTNFNNTDFTTNLKALAWDGTAEGGSIKIIEPYASTHVTAAKNEYAALMPDETQGDVAYKYFGISGAFTESLSRYQAVEGKLAAVTTTAVTEGEYTETMFNIPENSCLKLTVVVWLEGQDADCINAISGNDVTFDIKFTVPTAAAQG